MNNDELLEQICRLFDRYEWNYEIAAPDGARKAIMLGVTGENIQGVHFTIIPDEDNLSAILRVWDICNVPQKARALMLEKLNELNSVYRWVKFFIDSDDDIAVDMSVEGEDPENAAELIFEQFNRMVSIVDQAYPDIMRARYA